MDNELYDVLIVGSGLVGISLALVLRDSGLRIALVESHKPQAIPQDDSWDSRVYALSPGSIDFLTLCGVWQELPQGRVTPVYDMRIIGDDTKSHLDFSAYDAGQPQLATIVENRLLQDAMLRAVHQCEVDYYCPAVATAIAWHEDHVALTLGDDKILRSKLLVGADGVNSRVREMAGIVAENKPYGQMGVVANFDTELFHRNRAWQWFSHDGVLAYLPLPGNRISVVWSLDEPVAKTVVALSGDMFCEHVAEAGQYVLGKLQLISSPRVFPLQLLKVAEPVAPRVVLIGDAAHCVHPLAGQGVNLGFQDAQQLANMMCETKVQKDCGDVHLLRSYQRARKESVLVMQLATDGLQRLFHHQHSALGLLRNFGLASTNRLPFAKNLLVQHALG